MADPDSDPPPPSGEHARIAALRRRLAAHGAAPGVVLGPGDDAALLRPAAGLEVATVDAAVEGIHFRRGWAPLDALARRAVVAAVSDVAAMGGRARAVLLALAVPGDLDDVDFDLLIEGAAGATRDAGAALVGGNLTRAPGIAITTTVLGEVEPPALCRSGARIGDAVWVLGRVGHARVGLEALLRRDADGTAPPAAAAPCVEAWRAPVPQLEASRALRGLATAAIDLSDGLAQDAGHLCAESRVGARLAIDALVEDPDLAAGSRAVGLDPVVAVAGGGDDYALLFTLPPEAAAPPGAVRLGDVVPPDRGLRLLNRGREIPAVDGWDHYRAGSPGA